MPPRRAAWPRRSPSTRVPKTRAIATTTTPTTARPACATPSIARSAAQLKQQLVGRSLGNTYRSESVRLAWPAKWMAFGFHLGMAGYGDRPLSRWEEAFIPMRLRDSLREVKRADGRPLVASEEPLLPHRLSMPPDEMPRWRLPALLTGIALALAVVWLGRRRPGRWPRWPCRSGWSALRPAR